MKKQARLDRVTELTSALLDGTASKEQCKELNALLSGDPDACERYLDLIESHASLIHDHLADDLAASAIDLSSAPISRSENKAIPFSGKRRLPWVPIAVAASLALLLNVAAIFFLSPRDSSEPVAEEEWVAVLSHLVNATWGGDTTRFLQGSPLPPGTFRLEGGLAQIEFFSGASVIVEGPAELELVSPWLIECREGRLRTSVPEPAQGFSIVTPTYEAVDLGTEFSLSVSPDDKSELHVVEGEVRIDDKSGQQLRHLTTGNGIRSKEGILLSLSGGGSDFVDREQLLTLARKDRVGRYQQWLLSRDQLIEDPDTLLFYDFENQNAWDRQLENRAGIGSQAAVIGAQWTRGRWPGKGALNFKRITDRVRLHLPGSHEAITLAAWVKIESLDSWYSSLLLTDGFDEGEPHWQISNHGELILGLGGEQPPNTISEPVISPSDLGRWVHLAVTIDRESLYVVHYVDGQPVKSHLRPSIPKLTFGEAEIGNWKSEDKSGHPIRSFNGRIDEFLILQRALQPAEILALYSAGSPND
ncbi:MAG: LamG-like jellyroll fold domain-containing protein [Verrucomicrobiota bacterium]